MGMVYKEKQSIIIQRAQRFLKHPCLMFQIEVSKFIPKHFYRKGVNQTKQIKNPTKGKINTF